MCKIYGVPEPRTIWMKNGKPINVTAYVQIVDHKHLRILGLLQEDAGFYQCFGETYIGNNNEKLLGSIQASVQLLVVRKGMYQHNIQGS